MAIEEASGEVLAAAAKSFLYGDDGSKTIFIYVAYTVGGFLLLSLDFFFSGGYYSGAVVVPPTNKPRG